MPEITNRYKVLRRRAAELLSADTPLAELLSLGIRCIKEVEADPRYVVKMGRWHEGSPRTSDRPCEVCMAGAIVAVELGADPTMKLSPSDFEIPEAKVLIAVDRLRYADVCNALRRLDRPWLPGVAWEACHVAPYYAGPEVWHHAMGNLAEGLQEAGL